MRVFRALPGIPGIARSTGIAALLAAALAGCAERERLNPLDPENEQTGGMLAGFNALAGNGQVEIRWSRLTQTGVLGYQLQRWRPGEAPANHGDLYGSQLAGAVDTGVTNAETYIYRLIARLASGDSSLSPPDTATPGTRRIAALAAGPPGLVGLTPDARDILFTQAGKEAYEDMEVDRVHNALWLTLVDAGEVERLTFDGSIAGPTIELHAPADVSVSNLRGIGWVAAPAAGLVHAFGPSIATVDSFEPPLPSGEAHVAEAGTQDATVWIGNETGNVYRYLPKSHVVGSWSLGARVVAIALDQTVERAWVVTRSSTTDTLHRIDGLDSSVTTVAQGLRNVADVEVDPTTRRLWISERGTPRAGAGRLSWRNDQGIEEGHLDLVEPFGLTVDPATGNAWVTDLRSNRILEVTPAGAIVRWSASIDVPYAVRLAPTAAP